MKALFLGKFQPPHLGHVRTILKVAREYDSVVVGITMGEIKAIEYQSIKCIFDEVFASFDNIEVRLIEGTIEGGTSNIDCFEFDVVVSGNRKVLSKLSEQGFKSQFFPRTEGQGYSGSEIRGLVESGCGKYIENRAKGYDFKVVRTEDLKPLELVLPSHLKNIEKLIIRDGVINKPLIVDAKYNVVLDGSHRLAFLLKYGYKYAPVILVDYNDDAIFVGNHLKHRYIKDKDFLISKSEVLRRALSEQFLPARTTRHFFPFRKKDYPVRLEDLEKGKLNDIDYLIQRCSLQNEIDEDEKYICEIEEEIAIIKDYLSEQEGVKRYLNYQLNEMKREALGSVKLEKS